MWRTIIALAAACGAAAEWRRVELAPQGRELRGAAVGGGALLVWGDGVPTRGDFGPGGCAGDVDGDGRLDLLLHRRPDRMVWLRAPDWREALIDTDADFDDCLWTTLFGVPGALVVHRRAQVRFYHPPADAGRWPYEEIYSIYTPSAQGGLGRADVDGDGLEDILCGNYWIRSPAGAGLPWRLFAIGDWWERERSAMLRLVVAGGGKLLAAQREADPARIAWFLRPSDPKLFWRQAAVPAVSPPLRNVQGLVVAGGRVVAAENAGPGSRVVELGAGVVDRTDGLFGLWESGGGLVGVGARAVVRYADSRKSP
jgi:hypothetical protein